MASEAIKAMREVRTSRDKNPDPHGRIDSHEEVCAFRWGFTLDRLDRIEKILIGAAGSIIAGMAGLLVLMLVKGGVH